MGCERELDVDEARARDAYYEREKKLRHELSTVPLGEFTLQELGPLMRLMGLEYGFMGTRSVGDRDLELLEAKLKKIKKE